MFLAGITSVSGGLLAGVIASGSVVFFLLDNVFSVSSWYAVIVGASVIVTVIFNPEGLVGRSTPGLMPVVRRPRLVTVVTVFVVTGPAGTGAASAGLAGAGPARGNGAPWNQARSGSGAALLRVQGLTVRYGGLSRSMT